MSDLLLTENRDGVLIVTFNRPDKKNAINTAMWIAIRETFRSAAQDDAVVCVLLCGAGENFCSGVDLSSFGEGLEEGEEHPFESAARAVAEFDKPIVAAAQGAAVGGGATVLFEQLLFDLSKRDDIRSVVIDSATREGGYFVFQHSCCCCC